MALVSSSIPNLINGISQQPPEVRLPSQGEIQENGLAKVVRGLEKRPGTESVQKLDFTPTGTYLIHPIRRDETEEYTLILGKSGSDKFIKVFDGDGNAMPVQGSTFSDIVDGNLAYFSEVTDFSTQVSATTVTDTTFFCSSKKTVIVATADGQTSGQDDSDFETDRGTSDVDTDAKREALVYVKQGGFSAKYIITIKVGSTYYRVGYQAPANQPVNNQQYIGTDTIAKILHEGASACGSGTGWGEFGASEANLLLEGFGGRKPTVDVDTDGGADGTYIAGLQPSAGSNMPSGMTCTRTGSLLHFVHTSAFEISTEDSHGDTDIFAISGAYGGGVGTKAFSDLPAQGAKNGFVAKVKGDNTINQDDFYVKFEADDLGKGVWRECLAPQLDRHFNVTTMPHRLVRLFDDDEITTANPLGITFVFEPVTSVTDTRTVDTVSTAYERIGWRARLAGDDDLNPFPSFVGGAITDIFFHKNRLGFLNDENVIFSESGNYYNFFPLTVITGVDSNPIDVTVSNDKVSLLKHAVPFSETLLFFSELQQFKLSEQAILSPSTVSIDVTTQFETDARAKPVSVGRYVFFAFQRGEFSGVREYFVDNRKEVNDAVEVTAHVPQYIPGKITNLVSSSNEQILVCQSSDEPQNLYIYKYYWQASDKIKSSWSVWKFGNDILNCSFIGSTLQILINRSDGAYLENINLSTDSSIAVMEDDTSVLLDRRVKIKTSTSIDTFSDLPYTGIQSLAITTAGATYTAGNLTATGGGGSGFTGTFTVTGGAVATVTITAAGSGYTSAPTIVLSTSGDSNAVITPTIALPSDIIYVNQNAQKVAQADVDTQIVAGDTIYAGIPYNFKYQFTRFHHKEQDKVTVQTAKLQLRNINVLYSNTGFFKLNVEVAPYTINVPDPNVLILTSSTLVATDATVTVSSTAGLDAGMVVSGTGVPLGTTISSVTDLTHLELSANATISSSVITLAFNSGQTISTTPRKAYEKTFSGFITNSSQIGEYKLLSGSFKSSILSNPYNCRISLTNNEYLPCAFQSAEWEGFLHIRSQRI